MKTHDSILVARGQGRNLFAVAILLIVLAVAMPLGMTAAGHQLPWDNVHRVWAVAAVVIAALFVVGMFHARRRLVLRDGWVQISEIFGTRSFHVTELSALTIQTLGSYGEHQYPSDHLTFWVDEGVRARLELRCWRREEMTELVARLTSLHPSIQVAPEVYQALEMLPAQPAMRTAA